MELDLRTFVPSPAFIFLVTIFTPNSPYDLFIFLSVQPERQRGLLAVAAALLDSGDQLPSEAVPCLFRLLVTVAGHVSDADTDTARTAAGECN